MSLFAKGGKGGIGNARFKSSTNRAPRQFTEGTWAMKGFMVGVEVDFDGLVGYPNAGKSTYCLN